MDKEYISPQQCMLLLAGFGVGTSVLLIPTILIQHAQQAALISIALAFIPGIVLVSMLSSLNKWYPGQSLVQYSVSILGLPGKLIGLLFIWYALHSSTLVLRDMGIFINITMLAQTPTTVIYLLVVGVSAFGIVMGLETISRSLALLVFLACLISGLLLFFTLPYGDFQNMLPILGNNDWSGIVTACFILSSFPVGEFILFGMLIFNIKGAKQVIISLIQGQIIAAIIGITVFIQVITVLGVARASHSIMAIVSVLNAIPSSNLLLIPFSLTWFIFTIVKFFICYYAFIVGFAHWTGIDDYRPLVLPGGALIIGITIVLFEGVGEHQNYNQLYGPIYSTPIEYGIPLLLWLAAGLKILIPGSGRRP
ncbi:GerAB/ArcD/ProY family transporter [Desulfotomaculum sp. 1211_IL3151]|uniref:GerAB/ArcD/ProY family transporter n=1 Tax=Desulfotomaculum sp. 1211_IL3151 TaxID=3084055 RepID=UPI002FDB22F7